MRTPGMSCFRTTQFLKTNTLQGNVATLFGCGEMCSMCIIIIIIIIANFLLNVTVKKNKSINIRWRYEQELEVYFLGYPVK